MGLLTGPEPSHTPHPRTYRVAVELNHSHRAALAAIVSDPSVMWAVGSRECWDGAKLDRFLGYCAEEALATRFPERGSCRYRFIGVVANGILVGVAGVAPILYDPDVRGCPGLTLFIGQPYWRQRHGSWAAARVLELYRRDLPLVRQHQPIYAHVMVANRGMRAILEQLGFDLVGLTRLRGANYFRYCLSAPPPPPLPAAA